MKATVTAELLRVRAQPNTESAVLGMLPEKAELDVVEVSNGWASVQLRAGNAAVRKVEENLPAVAYVAAEYLHFIGVPIEDPDPKPPPQPTPTPPPIPAPSPTSTFRLGINALGNTGLAKREAEQGCKFFLIIDDFLGATQLKQAHPDAVVMARRYFGNTFPSIDQALRGLEGAASPNLVYIGNNEADAIGQDGDALRRRAQFDVEMARRIRQISGATYAAGTFSMGCPDFTNQQTCDIVREIYAPAYNSGLLAMDMHLYSPDMQHIDQPNEWIWFERRWEFLFTKCGFDPNVRAIYCSETGVDEMGVGGFPAHGATNAQFADWSRKYIELQQRPVVVNGQAYPAPILGGAIFQLGGNNDKRWQGYDITNYLRELRGFYVPATRGLSLAMKRRSTAKPAKAQSRRTSKARKTKTNKTNTKLKNLKV